MRPFLAWLLRRCISLIVVASFLLSLAACGLWAASRNSHANFSLELSKTLIDAQFVNGSLLIERTSDWPSYSMLGTSKSMEFDPADIKRQWGVTIIPGHPVFYQIYSPTLESLGVVRGGGVIVNGNRRPQLQAIKVVFPAWYPLVVTSIPMIVYLVVMSIKAPGRIIRFR